MNREPIFRWYNVPGLMTNGLLYYFGWRKLAILFSVGNVFDIVARQTSPDYRLAVTGENNMGIFDGLTSPASSQLTVASRGQSNIWAGPAGSQQDNGYTTEGAEIHPNKWY